MSHNYFAITNTPYARSHSTDPFCYWLDIFNKEELKNILDLMAQVPVEDARIGTGLVDPTVRKSKTAFHSPNITNKWIFDRLNQVIHHLNSQFYNFDLNGYDKFQYSEYHHEDQGMYNWHIDTSFGQLNENRQDMIQSGDFENRKLSLTLFLNDDYEGGEFELICGQLDNPIKIDKAPGKLIIFPSFLFHRITPVTQGIRKSIVAWVVGPKFR